MKRLILILFLLFLPTTVSAEGTYVRSNDPLIVYFADGLHVFLMTEFDEVRVAMLAAAKVATPEQREVMTGVVGEVIKILNTDNPEFWVGPIRVLKELMRQSESKVWSTKEVIEEKLNLYRLDKDFAAALEYLDPTVFRRRYPGLFPQ